MIVRIDDATKLSAAEKVRLNEMMAEKKKQYREEASKRFDSDKNRSIMIQDKHNEMRNDVMRRIYSKQLEKRRKVNCKKEAISLIKDETRKQEEENLKKDIQLRVQSEADDMLELKSCIEYSDFLQLLVRDGLDFE